MSEVNENVKNEPQNNYKCTIMQKTSPQAYFLKEDNYTLFIPEWTNFQNFNYHFHSFKRKETKTPHMFFLSFRENENILQRRK